MQSTGVQSSSQEDNKQRNTLQSKKVNRPSQYQKLDLNLRKTIIDQVINQGIPLRQVAVNQQIKYSTAKAILQVYQNEGRIGKKITRDKRIFHQIESYILIVNKRTGKIDKIKIQSQSNDLSHNQNQDKEKLEEEHYTKVSQALSNFNFDPNYSSQNLPDHYNQLVSQLINQHKLIKQQ